MISIFENNKDSIKILMDIPSRDKNQPIEKSLSKSPLKDHILGISIMFWDLRAGPRNLSSFPPNFKLGMPQFMQIYANYQAHKEPGLYSVGNLDKTLYFYRRKGEDDLFLILETDIQGHEDYIEKILKQNG